MEYFSRGSPISQDSLHPPQQNYSNKKIERISQERKERFGASFWSSSPGTPRLGHAPPPEGKKEKKIMSPVNE